MTNETADSSWLRCARRRNDNVVGWHGRYSKCAAAVESHLSKNKTWGTRAVWGPLRDAECEVYGGLRPSAVVEKFTGFVVTARGTGSLDFVRLSPHYARDDRL